MSSASIASFPRDCGVRKSRVIVIQVGARRSYLAAAIFARHGMLERLYTDICANAGMIKPLARGLSCGGSLLPKPVRRLLGRIVPPEIRSQQVRTIDGWALLNYLAKPLRNYGIYVPFTKVPVAERLHRRLLKDGFGGATALYTLLHSDLNLARKAREMRLSVVHDQYYNPAGALILREEWSRFPGIEPEIPLGKLEADIALNREKWALSDLILAPSEFVRNGIIRLGGPSERTVVLPFGIRAGWLERAARPQRGRVLFVGSVGLLKGSHYLAEATRLLQKRGVNCEVRVVGPYNRRVIRRPEFLGPRYLGQIPRIEVHREFLTADFFVLPTLSEGSAMVHLEALASGLPVITTPHSGSVVRDGVDGFIVPIRDPLSLADRMERLLANQRLRDKMSENAHHRAAEFTWERYGERLLAAVERLGAQVA